MRRESVDRVLVAGANRDLLDANEGTIQVFISLDAKGGPAGIVFTPRVLPAWHELSGYFCVGPYRG